MACRCWCMQAIPGRAGCSARRSNGRPSTASAWSATTAPVSGTALSDRDGPSLTAPSKWRRSPVTSGQTGSASGGTRVVGAFALASAALLPGLVAGCCVFASLAPYDADGLDFAAGWSEAYRREVGLFFEDRGTAREHFRAEAAEQFAVLGSAQGWLDRWGDTAGTDAAHSREVAQYLAGVQQDCLGHGDDGWWEDWAALLSPWGFDVARIEVPVQLWHGEKDVSAPPSHGHWLAEHILGLDAHFPDQDDHASIETDHQQEAYEWLRRWVS